jgi:hypothetical protein
MRKGGLKILRNPWNACFGGRVGLAKDEAVVRGREWGRMEQVVDEKAWGRLLEGRTGKCGSGGAVRKYDGARATHGERSAGCREAAMPIVPLVLEPRIWKHLST